MALSSMIQSVKMHQSFLFPGSKSQETLILTKSHVCCCYCRVASVVSDSVKPHRRWPTRLLHPWDFPGKSTGVGCHFLLQCMKVKSESEAAQSCPTLSNPMDCNHQAPPMGFSRQEYWRGVPLPHVYFVLTSQKPDWMVKQQGGFLGVAGALQGRGPAAFL